MVTRSPAGNVKVFREQHGLLKDAIDDYYSGIEARAIDTAVRIRALVHNTDASRAFLATLDPSYHDLDIYRRKAPSKNVIFSLPVSLQISGGGKSMIIRDDFHQGLHELVPLKRWWTEEYLVIGGVRSSKKQVVLDVANKDGGAHVDPDVPARHVVASEPPFQFGTNEQFVRPNLAWSTVAQAGGELLDYLERHFAAHLVP
jgi:hypothetical protein